MLALAQRRLTDPYRAGLRIRADQTAPRKSGKPQTTHHYAESLPNSSRNISYSFSVIMHFSPVASQHVASLRTVPDLSFQNFCCPFFDWIHVSRLAPPDSQGPVSCTVYVHLISGPQIHVLFLRISKICFFGSCTLISWIVSGRKICSVILPARLAAELQIDLCFAAARFLI